MRINLQKTAPLAHAPLLAMETYARRNNDRRTNHLVKILSSQLNGCSFCIAMHSRDARKAGESDERIAALAGDWTAEDLWSPAERAALALTEEVTRLGEGGVSDPVWDETVDQWGEKGAAHLVMAIAAINVWNRVAIATGMEASDL